MRKVELLPTRDCEATALAIWRQNFDNVILGHT